MIPGIFVHCIILFAGMNEMISEANEQNELNERKIHFSCHFGGPSGSSFANGTIGVLDRGRWNTRERHPEPSNTPDGQCF